MRWLQYASKVRQYIYCWSYKHTVSASTFKLLRCVVRLRGLVEAFGKKHPGISRDGGCRFSTFFRKCPLIDFVKDRDGTDGLLDFFFQLIYWILLFLLVLLICGKKKWSLVHLYSVDIKTLIFPSCQLSGLNWLNITTKLKSTCLEQVIVEKKHIISTVNVFALQILDWQWALWQIHSIWMFLCYVMRAASCFLQKILN